MTVGVLLVHVVHVCLSRSRQPKRAERQVHFACDFSASIKVLWSLKTLKWSMTASKTTMGTASLDGTEDRQKTCVCCMRFFCGYQGIVEHHVHPDPQVEHVGSASLDGAKDRQKTGVLCMGVPRVCASIKVLWSNTKILTLKFSMATSKTTVGGASLDGAEDSQKKKVSVACIFSAGSQILWSIMYTLALKWSMWAVRI